MPDVAVEIQFLDRTHRKEALKKIGFRGTKIAETYFWRLSTEALLAAGGMEKVLGEIVKILNSGDGLTQQQQLKVVVV